MLVASIGTENWPVTTEGRMLAMLLSLYGLAMFGYITATFASFFVGRDAQEASGPLAAGSDVKKLLKELQALRVELASASSGAVNNSARLSNLGAVKPYSSPSP
jgi:voltage-gated potassium channel